MLKVTNIELIYFSSNSKVHESDVKVITIPKNTILYLYLFLGILEKELL